MVRRGLILAALTLVPGLALGQSLGQAAAQEKERREKASREGKTSSARVFTNDDLKGSSGASKEGSPPAAPPAATDAAELSQGRAREDAKARAWDERAKGLRDAIDRAKAQQAGLQGRIDQLQQQLNPMSATYVLDPNKFLRIQDEIRQAQTQLEGLKAQVVAAQEAWSHFEDEARGAGVPIRPTGEAQH